jgi:hypothetical protein
MFLLDYALMQSIMPHESYGSPEEELAWGQRLATVVRDQASLLRQREAKGSLARYGLTAPDGTEIGLATFPVNLDTQDSYIPPLGRVMAKDAYDLPGSDGAKYYQSMHQAHGVPGTQPEERPRLAFVVETKPDDQAASPTYAVSSAGEIERPAEAAHYEGFVDPDGNFVGLYKLGEEQKLEPVDDAEGQHLLSQIATSELV